MFDARQHFENSSLREIIVEHQFIGAALKRLWSAGIVDAEILRSEFDGFGYDLVMSKGSIVRHIQLKSGLDLKKISASQLLAQKPSGCVIFIQINDLLDVQQYFWFGDEGGQPLPEISTFTSTKRTTPNSEGVKPARAKHRDIPRKRFERLENLDTLLEKLLGQSLKVAT